MTGSGQSDTDPRRHRECVSRPLPEHETFQRDREFKKSIGVTGREGILWDEAWLAARSYYLARVGHERDARS
jgi:hypothetical protein